MKKILMSFTLLASLTSAACPMGCIHEVLAACGLSWTKQEFREIVDRVLLEHNDVTAIRELERQFRDYAMQNTIGFSLDLLSSPIEGVVPRIPTLGEYCYLRLRALFTESALEGEESYRECSLILKFFIEEKEINPSLPLVPPRGSADSAKVYSFLGAAMQLGLTEVILVLDHGARVTKEDIDCARGKAEFAKEYGVSPRLFSLHKGEAAEILAVLEEAFERQQQEL